MLFNFRRGCLLAGLMVLLFGNPVWSDEPVTEENYVPPGDNKPDEPLAEKFSLTKAVDFLDSASLDWQEQRGCAACHTNYLYLMARPAVSASAPTHANVRAFVESIVEKRWPESGPRWPAEVIATGVVLAYSDAQTTGKLHPSTRTALDRMWTLQREDGGFDWLKCNWPPMESDDYFGATFAALGVGVAPEGYAETPAAKVGLEKLRLYFKSNQAPNLHHEAMRMWASLRVEGIMTAEEQKACQEKLLALQHDDGGWGLASLGDWQRGDKKEQEPHVSDGYGTGFVIYVLRQCGTPASDARLQKGIAWLKSNQRASGRWFTRSLYKDNKHYLTHAGSAFAVMALQSCEEKTAARETETTTK